MYLLKKKFLRFFVFVIARFFFEFYSSSVFSNDKKSFLALNFFVNEKNWFNFVIKRTSFVSKRLFSFFVAVVVEIISIIETFFCCFANGQFVEIRNVFFDRDVFFDLEEFFDCFFCWFRYFSPTCWSEDAC